MPYSYSRNQFDDRPKNLTDPETGSVAHHRIPWNVLKGALNKVLAREADIGLVEALMNLRPSYDPRLLKEFNAAAFLAYRAFPTRRLSDNQIHALDRVEEAIFTLPVNLFFGKVIRDDDPGGDYMDFTPDDVDYAGAHWRTPDGRLQGLRERLFGQLCRAKTDKDAVKRINITVREIREAANPQALRNPTAFNNDHWHPGPTPPGVPVPERTYRAYRYWLKPTGEEVTLDDINSMMCKVTSRAMKAGTK